MSAKSGNSYRREMCIRDRCTELKEKYADPDVRCLHLVEEVADLLETYKK